MFIYKPHFFTFLPSQYCLGQQFMQQKKYLKITETIRHMLKTDIKGSSKKIWFLSCLLNSPQKWKKKKGKRAIDFLENCSVFFLKHWPFFCFFGWCLCVQVHAILFKNVNGSSKFNDILAQHATWHDMLKDSDLILKYKILFAYL